MLQPPTQLLSLFYPPPLHTPPNVAFCLRLLCLRLPLAGEAPSTRTRAEGGTHPQNWSEAKEWLLLQRAFY